MLSSIGRAAVKRLVSTTAATSLHRIAVPRLVANTPKPNHAFIRSFATPGRPKASTKQNATKKPVAKQAKSTKSETTPELIPKRVVRRRKPLTPEKEAILEKRELKKTALLSEPKSLPVIPWTVFVKEETNHKDVPDAIGLRGRMGQLAQDYKNLPASELQVSSLLRYQACALTILTTASASPTWPRKIKLLMLQHTRRGWRATPLQRSEPL